MSEQTVVITVSAVHGPTQIKATRHGHLAVHRAVKGEIGHTVTHVPAGLAITKQYWNLSRAEAEAFLLDLLDEGLDWSFTSPKQIPPATRARYRRFYRQWLQNRGHRDE